MFRTTLLTSLAALVVSAAPVMASNYSDFVESTTKSWFQAAPVIAAVQASNVAHAGLSENDILALDAEWRSAVGNPNALIDGILESGVSEYLRTQMAATEGRVTEVIVMDVRGLNVALTGASSDYWQGDEAKHQMTFGAGAGAVHVSEVEFDESTQAYQVQVSFTLVDPMTQVMIGAVTVGLNAELF